jgi:hypothetical protein
MRAGTRPLRFPDGIRDLLLIRYRNQRRNWLSEGAEAGERWPIAFRLDCPTEEDARRQPDGFRDWIAAWRSWQGAGELVWGERRWRGLGTQGVPEILRVHSPNEVAAWIGEEARWRRARGRYEYLVARWPLLSSSLPRYFDVLADYEAADFQRLEAMLGWLEANPQSNLYPRQLPVAGLDSKWLETRTALIGGLLTALRGSEAGQADFYDLCGLKRPPQLTRLMILDESLRAHTGGIRDLSAPVAELAGLNLPVSRVYIVENLQTGLAFGDLPGSVVFVRLGYGVDALAKLPWVSRAECVYWGDLDTHGLRILSRVRALLPRVSSILMDEQTLLAHRALWGEEAEQSSDAELPALSADEQLLYQRLKKHHWDVNVRLEQERIPWDYAWESLRTRHNRA